MSRLQFNQVFFGLMALSFISAFLVPPRITDSGRVQLEGLFIPISRPTYRMANWLRGRVAPDIASDTRPDQDIKQENLALRQEVSRLGAEVERLQGLAAERASLGDRQSLCERFTVAGVDSGNRQALILAGDLQGDIKTGQTVLHTGGLAGRVEGAGLGGAHVRLITDPGFVVTGKFGSYVKNNDGSVSYVAVSDLLPIVQGMGNEQMNVTNLSYADVVKSGVKAGDLISLADRMFPRDAQGLILGRIVSVSRWKRAPLFAEILLEPQAALMRLNDVWVMTREPEETLPRSE
ncbi:MAG: rod shape-determining protein MreC [Planctomycetota bacterium]|nr:rod shape-determining protein MreC [Planctomycetota bacterium]